MKISFDLDDTIIVNNSFECEQQTLMQRIFGVERIRLGTIALFKELKAKGHSICVYTTSYRSVGKIRFMFCSYGISIDEIINQIIHEKKVRSVNMPMSKYPPAFGIDIHIDDSIGVGMEGERYGFKTIIVSVDDNDWVNSIMKQI
ncbi:MAG: hypothetical protein IPK11_02480 [Ignavibacteria bacterium]|nr:hypothetical protein [Ignavibacteria bacterium]